MKYHLRPATLRRNVARLGVGSYPEAASPATRCNLGPSPLELPPTSLSPTDRAVWPAAGRRACRWFASPVLAARCPRGGLAIPRARPLFADGRRENSKG